MTIVETPLNTERELRFILNSKEGGLYCPGFARILPDPSGKSGGWWTAYVYFEIHFGKLKNSRYRNYFKQEPGVTYIGIGKPSWRIGFERSPGVWVGIDWMDRQQPTSLEEIKEVLLRIIHGVDCMYSTFMQEGLVLTDDAER